MTFAGMANDIMSQGGKWQNKLIMTVQEAIRKLRQSMNVSQEGLARSLDISVRTVARWESDPKGPTKEVLLTLRSVAKSNRQTELALFFKQRYLAAVMDELGEDDYSKFQEQIAKVGSPANLEAVRKAVRSIWKECWDFNDPDLTVPEAVDIGERIQDQVEALAELVFVSGKRELTW